MKTSMLFIVENVVKILSLIAFIYDSRAELDFGNKVTIMCVNIGTPKNNKFSICSKWKINYFRCPKIWAHYSLVIIC